MSSLTCLEPVELLFVCPERFIQDFLRVLLVTADCCLYEDTEESLFSALSSRRNWPWACGLFLTSRFRVLWWIKFLLSYLLIKCCLHLTKGINEPNIFLMVSFSQSSLCPFNFPLFLKREKQYSSVQLEYRRCTPHDPWDLQCGLRERVSALCVQSPLLKSVPTLCGYHEGDTRECLEQ